MPHKWLMNSFFFSPVPYLSLCYGPSHAIDGRQWSTKLIWMHYCSLAIKFLFCSKWFVLLLVVMLLSGWLGPPHLDFMESYIKDSGLICFSVHIIKHRGFGLWQTSHRSHYENDSHLNTVIKGKLKHSNETKLIKTSCNDERGSRCDPTRITQHTRRHASMLSR